MVMIKVKVKPLWLPLYFYHHQKGTILTTVITTILIITAQNAVRTSSTYSNTVSEAMNNNTNKNKGKKDDKNEENKYLSCEWSENHHPEYDPLVRGPLCWVHVWVSYLQKIEQGDAQPDVQDHFIGEFYVDLV